MIITNYSNIDLIQGVIAYGNATEGITDWRITNTLGGANGVFNILNSSSIITPSGGTTEIGQIANSTDRYMIFKGGTSTFTVPAGGIVCDILVVGGGGGGGSRHAGGGGAGAVIYLTNQTLSAGSYSISVGNGGTGKISPSGQGTIGGDSSVSFNSTTIYLAKGGGAGNHGISTGTSNKDGGSGGGAGLTPSGLAVTTNIPSGSYGNSGGIGVGGYYEGGYAGGGGGGAGGSGTNAVCVNNTNPAIGGKGGDGIQITITGTATFYGGGGGGGVSILGNVAGQGGAGGGGHGSKGAITATNGTDGTGGGGGGGGFSDPLDGNGGNGGSGIVIIRYYTANISIIDNGNVGIGTTPISASSKLEIFGDVNTSGIYRKNNRDVISDTSNYVLTTSNLFVSRIIAEVGNGSNYVSRIATQLNTIIDDTSNYVARSTFIANSVVSSSQWTNISSGIHYTPPPSLGITSSPPATTVGTVASTVPTGAIGDYTYMVFTYTTETAGVGSGQSLYTINVPVGSVVCDILVVGGGGGGSGGHGGGGGAGQLVFINQATLNGTYTIKVGKGGTGGRSTELANSYPATKGANSTFSTVTAEAGGTNTSVSTDKNGGSGAGGDFWTSDGGTGGFGVKDNNVDTFASGTVYSRGNDGGNINGSIGGGGGGAGVAANLNVGGDGLSGITEIKYDFLQNFGTSVGEYFSSENKVYFAGGGGGGALASIAGKGGGGIGGTLNNGAVAPSGLPNTGGGGGGGGGGSGTGGNGGSGVVILRFLSSTRNVGIGTTNPTSELHVFDDTTTNTKLTVQNNYIDPIVISPNTIGYTVAETLESNKYYRTLTFNYFPNYPEDPPNTALLAWYRLNGDGLDYNPYATKYNLVADEGTPTYSSGTTADSFLQGRRYINTAGGSLKNTTISLASRAFSVSMWLRFKIAGQGASILCQSTTQTLNTTLYIGARGNAGYFLGFHGNDLECGIGVSGSPTSYPGDINTWVHLVYVVLPNYNRRIYRNGVLIATDSNTSAFTGTGELSFNRRYWNGNAYVNMDVSEIRIYNNGLSATEVAILYASYTNLVITDNYTVNFKSSTALLVNGASKTVNGEYIVSMGHINDSMLPASGQVDIPLTSTELTTLPIKYEYNNTALTLPTLITVAGATSSFIGTTERAISFTYTSDSPGLTGQTQYSFTPAEDIWCDILVVGGGGGGGKFGGGGGGGGVIFSTNLKLNAGNSVAVKVGNGGTGATVMDGGINGINGYNSSITINSIEYIAVGGGGGGSRGGSPNYIGTNGTAGGSGGGGGITYTGTQASLGGVSNKNNYANFISFGNDGGKGIPNIPSVQPMQSAGGGGGAGSKGSDFSYITGGGNGGRGKEFLSYFGTNVGHFGYFAGGGGGNTYAEAGNRGYGNGGLGLYGGGGNGGYDGVLEYSADNGLANTGGGGGGSKYDGTTSGSLNGGAGGSGFVIIRYRKNITQSTSLELITAKQVPNEIVVSGASSTTIGSTDRCIIFPYTSDNTGSGQTQYTFTTTEQLNCDILMVAGGGAGGKDTGGGGGGGAVLYGKNISIPVGTYTIKVGNGAIAGDVRGKTTEGFGATLLGGGSGTNTTWGDGTTVILANSGGSGAGGHSAYSSSTRYAGGSVGVSVKGSLLSSATLYSGNIGGSGITQGPITRQPVSSGGGGGAGSAGDIGTDSGTKKGCGGAGIFVNILEQIYLWGAGGGGGAYQAPAGDGGLGGGGIGETYTSPASYGANGDVGAYGYSYNTSMINAGNGTGSGGGGGAQGTSVGGSGGSGIVIIRYRRTTGNTGYNIGNYGGDFKVISSSYTSTSQDIDFLRITSDGSSIYNPTGTPLWSTVSDRRIKENIERASYDKCYDNINNLELYRFRYIEELENINRDKKQLGYIAQEVREIFPKAVTEGEYNNERIRIEDMLSIDVTQINYTLYGAVKKLMEKYRDRKERLERLERELGVIG